MGGRGLLWAADHPMWALLQTDRSTFSPTGTPLAAIRQSGTTRIAGLKWPAPEYGLLRHGIPIVTHFQVGQWLLVACISLMLPATSITRTRTTASCSCPVVRRISRQRRSAASLSWDILLTRVTIQFTTTI